MKKYLLIGVSAFVLGAGSMAYFSQQALDDFSSSLKPLGAPTTFHQLAEELRGGMTFHVFAVTFKNSPQQVHVTTYTMPDGKLEQYLVEPVQ